MIFIWPLDGVGLEELEVNLLTKKQINYGDSDIRVNIEKENEEGKTAKILPKIIPLSAKSKTISEKLNAARVRTR